MPGSVFCIHNCERIDRAEFTSGANEVSATNVNDARHDIMSDMGARNAGVCFLYEKLY